MTPPSESLAMVLILEVLQYSRSGPEFGDYEYLASKIPKLDALHYDVNKLLSEWNESDRVNGKVRYICDFRAGDRKIWFRSYPTKLSKETIRRTLVNSGLRELKNTGTIKVLEELAESIAIYNRRNLINMDFKLQKHLERTG